MFPSLHPEGPTEIQEAESLLWEIAAAFLGPDKPRLDRETFDPRGAKRLEGLVAVDSAGTVLSINAAAEKLFGFSPTELVGRPAVTILPLPESTDPSEVTGTRKDGTSLPLLVCRSEMEGADRPFTILGIREVDAAHLSDEELRRAEFRFRTLVEQIPAVTFMAAMDGGLNELYISPQVESLLGYTQEEWLADPVLWYNRLHLDDRTLWNEEFARGCKTGGPFRAECRFMARDGSTVWVHGEARLVRDQDGNPLFLQGVAFDITANRVATEKLKASLREKEILLKEIHHRVKNNLQVTSSLLRLQSGSITDATAQALLKEGEHRIRSMSLVHEMLYRSKDLGEVDFAAYIPTLSDSLCRSYGVYPSRVKIEIEVRDVFLDIARAVPCGLIVNELMSNVFKHAFPADRTGKMIIRMNRIQGNDCELVVWDDGVGFPPGLDFRNTQTLGLQLVLTLAEQLEGTVTVNSTGGTEVRIRFDGTPMRKEPVP